MKVGDFVIAQFDGPVKDGKVEGYDERLCLVTGTKQDWFELLFSECGAILNESLPKDRVKPAGFDFERLTDECDTQNGLSHLAALPEQRQR